MWNRLVQPLSTYLTSSILANHSPTDIPLTNRACSIYLSTRVRPVMPNTRLLVFDVCLQQPEDSFVGIGKLFPHCQKCNISFSYSGAPLQKQGHGRLMPIPGCLVQCYSSIPAAWSGIISSVKEQTYNGVVAGRSSVG